MQGFRQIGALLLPSHMPDETGIGCPKCDDHEMVPLAAGPTRIQEETTKFMQRHLNCGPLETLERRGGRVGITGSVDPRAS